jgi:hypothetical protein
LKFENTEVFNLEGAFRGMRNPMDSWDKSDSKMTTQSWSRNSRFKIGKKDLELAQKLIKGGSEHRKFMRQILICVDITAPRLWWQEFDTYKVGTVANSCSTMHKIKDYSIDGDMFESLSNLDDYDIEFWDYVIHYLENRRQKYNETKDFSYIRKLKFALPESFLQRRTVTMNYENILNIVHQRGNHRLLEWSTNMMNWIKEELPYSEELILA